MGPASIPTLRRATAGTLLVLAVGVGLAPAKALAGCDHAAAVDGGNGPGHFESLATAGALPKSPRGTGGKAPCSGPTCSDAPHAPPAPAPMDLGTVVEWGYLADVVTIPTPRPSLLPTSSAPVRPGHLGASVFHPPRSLAHL
jgi:hypothetical protein